MVIGEGAGTLVLEELEHARARGANIIAEVVGYGATSDGYDMVQPSGEGAVRCMQQAMSTVDEPVDYINAHGTATEVNDAAETHAIRQAFGEHANKLAISATKSMHGHALGASSALELVATTLATYHGHIPPTANFTVADEQCDLDYVPNQARQIPVKVVLSNSFGFGGQNASIVIAAYDLKSS